jgi:hypothetical protein
MSSKSISKFTSSDLSPVVALWKEHFQQFNDRVTITPGSAGIFSILGGAKQLQAQIFRAADGGTMVNITYRQPRAMDKLLAECGVALPPQSTIVGKGSDGGAIPQVGVVRIPPAVPVETALTFILQALTALSEKPLEGVFHAQADRMRPDRQLHT